MYNPLTQFPDVPSCQCDILDKEAGQVNYILNMFNRTNQMFEYDGLPDTVPAEMLELILQMNGHICWYQHNDSQLYCLAGGPGGPPDPYYRPTLYTVANPALGIGKQLKILNYLPPRHRVPDQGNCVLMKNDTNFRGLMPTFARYATQMVENDISVRSAQINSRAQVFITTDTDTNAAAAKLYIAGLEAGKLEVAASKDFLDGVKAQNVSVQGANTIIQLIELQQYLKASWYNELGLNANFNMKREYQSEEELQANNDVLLPMIDNMLQCREEAIEVVNDTFGTNITVKKGSSWANKQEEVETAQALAKNEAEAVGEGEVV